MSTASVGVRACRPPQIPASAPPGTRYLTVNGQYSTLFSISSLFTDPCSTTNWTLTKPGLFYPGVYGGAVKSGAPSANFCRIGFTLRPQGTWVNGWRPDALVITLRRANTAGGMGVGAYFSIGSTPVVINQDGDLNSEITLTLNTSSQTTNLNRIYCYCNQISANSAGINSLYCVFIGYIGAKPNL